MGLFLGVFLSFFLVSQSSYSSPFCPDSNAWVVSADDSLKNLTETSSDQKLDFNNLKLLVWNVYKGGKFGMHADLNFLTQKTDLALLQEGSLSKTFSNLVCSRQDLNWKMAKNYEDSMGTEAGVVTASRQNPDAFTYIKSPNTEPFSDVHKMTLVTYYNIPDSTEQLLVLNIHGINFVPVEYFKNQIRVVAEVIKKHTGPVIFAGDFNTYVDARKQFLLQTMNDLGLIHAEVSGNEYAGLIVLDHLFYRGFEITKTEVLKHITTSDHLPLYFELTLK